MFDGIFKFLFKYQLLVFEQGRFVFGASRSMQLVALAAGAAALYTLWTYRQLRNATPRARATLLAIRISMLLLVLLALMRPMLLLKRAVDQQNFVGILVDDSRSMQIADENGKPRADFIKNQFGKVDAELLTQLAKKFEIRLIRFSSSSERLQSAADLTFEGTGSHIGDAFDRARAELSGLPVAGLIMATDGADTTDKTIDQAIAGLKSQSMPVFTVGVGRETLTHDVQVSRVETPHRVLKGTALVLDVVVTQSGYSGAKVPLIVEDAGRVISSQDITLPGNGESATIKVRFVASEVGPRVFHFKIPGQSNEEVTQNNARDALIEVYDRREKILYLDGDPRPEPKFIRQATDLDNNLQVVLLLRTAEATSNVGEKYLRLGVDGPEELQNGFPATREELFAYRSIILGNIEASAFTRDQQRMLEDFVDVRGGSLLMLGGPRAFAEGGWAGTPLADASPFIIGPRPGTSTAAAVTELVIRPTRAGTNHPATQIADTEALATAKWRELPALTSTNVVHDVKPGATILLEGLDERNRVQTVLAFQRYGKGKALALSVQDSWLWRMHSTMPVKDTTHHTFWQRMSRWMVDGVPDRVMASALPDHVQKGEPITLNADVLDPEYKGINDGHITAHVTSPSGKSEDVPMEWTVKHDGQYAARFTPEEDGLYKVRIGGTREGKDVGANTMTVRVAPSDAEYFDAAMRAPLLKRIAEDTEGRFFKASDTSKLVDAITYSGKGITVVEEKDLWDMPIILLLLLTLMGGEWMYRRAQGLA